MSSCRADSEFSVAPSRHLLLGLGTFLCCSGAAIVLLPILGEAGHRVFFDGHEVIYRGSFVAFGIGLIGLGAYLIASGLKLVSFVVGDRGISYSRRRDSNERLWLGQGAIHEIRVKSVRSLSRATCVVELGIKTSDARTDRPKVEIIRIIAPSGPSDFAAHLRRFVDGKVVLDGDAPP